MSVLSAASQQSAYRGYSYWKEDRIHELEISADGTLTAKVSGSENNMYDVTVNTAHPRKSSCTCPHAAGRHIVCKHMVAVFITAFPSGGLEYQAMLERGWEDDEDEYDYYDECYIDEESLPELEASVTRSILKMKKTELQALLMQLLFEGPEWQLRRFVVENTDYYH